jgi:hypothetical protein
MLLKYRSKPKFRFNKIYLRPLKNGRISKADDYFWKINRKLKAHYRPTVVLELYKFAALNRTVAASLALPEHQTAQSAPAYRIDILGSAHSPCSIEDLTALQSLRLQL